MGLLSERIVSWTGAIHHRSRAHGDVLVYRRNEMTIIANEHVMRAGAHKAVHARRPCRDNGNGANCINLNGRTICCCLFETIRLCAPFALAAVRLSGQTVLIGVCTKEGCDTCVDRWQAAVGGICFVLCFFFGSKLNYVMRILQKTHK